MGAASSVRQQSTVTPCRFLDPAVGRRDSKALPSQTRVSESVSSGTNVCDAAGPRNTATYVPTVSQTQSHALAQLCSQAKEALAHASARENAGKLTIACEAYQLAADIYSKARIIALSESNAKAKAMKDAEVAASFPAPCLVIFCTPFTVHFEFGFDVIALCCR
jgi:hypothetical protein